ncbi:MAG: (d)CMP kinase [Pigeon pea little leaf phytoplasma]|uniref:Cytidylate kinase n=1 Tax=Candidatus Phytoplasma fabacearum TaxID=2982628 RepID=A0ABU8ZSI8_9MOLU|nr:(d)CMP kinase ['Bituminaria bituminosa' little leaf phytoplasma]MDV3148810.1 (d)CMP kinase [Pigeon pea little leaf phytoplasma]MDO7983596.1 (d)CMP kinase ['Bituminaria bituminosa' little leaf phytoplasma]MDO8023751.1 (d)CMP kinase ['Bituminaria bituminosa' little leaf phytoplasma]MDO8030430.1 (d)CMP kinase ['Bituminaria bituminosa' little leaf phytoplasma]MDV3153951.1 (d)CMP kinase [Pigeon pea little leaf phytoplasma]
MNFKVAIDGPAGAGKSTVSRLLANKLKWFYLNTGLLFRLITFYILKNEIRYNNDLDITKLEQLLKNLNIMLTNNGFYLNNEYFSVNLNDCYIEKKVSNISSLLPVRNKILILQYQMIRENDYIIMDGRDIGTVVMPDADLKIFLTASIEQRALRKQKELKMIGQDTINLSEIMETIRLRDLKDEKRPIAPLKQAVDAILIDSTNISVKKTVNLIEDLIKKKMLVKNV